MDDRKVMISEAAKLVDVESHVLRYWEDELHIPVKRTAQGHRYYTKEDLQLFHCIKRLKDETVSIKELKQIVPELLKAQELHNRTKNQVSSPVPDSSVTPDSANISTTPSISTSSHTEVIEDLPLKQARELIGAVLNEVVTDNNKVLTRELRQTLTADIMQEMDFLVQAKERKEEDHFRKLDQLIRQQQSIRRETVGHANPLLRLKRLLT